MTVGIFHSKCCFFKDTFFSAGTPLKLMTPLFSEFYSKLVTVQLSMCHLLFAKVRL